MTRFCTGAIIFLAILCSVSYTRGQMAESTTSITIRVPARWKGLLENRAAQEDLTISQLMRRIVRADLDRRSNKRRAAK